MSTFHAKLAETLALRDSCAPIFLPLFDHCVSLARASFVTYERATYSGKAWLARRAGRELAHARKVAGYPVCHECGSPIRDGSGGQCSALLDTGKHARTLAVKADPEPSAFLRDHIVCVTVR